MYGRNVPIVMEALRTRAPKLYRKLETSGQLEGFVRDKAEEINEAIHQTRSSVIVQTKVLSKTDYLTKVQDMTKIDRAASEVVLNELLEFPTDDEPEDRSA